MYIDKELLSETNTQAALNELSDNLLKTEWHAIDPMSQEQVKLIVSAIKRKYKAADMIAYYRKHPTEFVEYFTGCKLSWWQRIFIKHCWQHKIKSASRGG